MDEELIRALFEKAANGDGVVHLGFTGTRNLSAFGKEAIVDTIRGFAEFCDLTGVRLEIVHGGCVGADTFAGESGLIFSGAGAPIDVHTCLPEDMSRVPADWRMKCHTYEHVPGGYRARNKAIVRRADVLFGVADYPEHHGRSKRSGTWMTIRIGREAQKPVMVLVQHDD